MLTVIGIIVLLVSILLPVVSAVRVKAHQADTMALLARIAAGAESYNADFRSYPGPFPNAAIHNAGYSGTPVKVKGGSDIPWAKITMAENFTVGLIGGIHLDSSGALEFDPDLVGEGPSSLNARAPKKSRAYMDKVNLTPMFNAANKVAGWDYKDEADDADDSPLPEWVDKFPDPMPILILRAKTGARGVVSNTTVAAEQEQYDLNQVIGYTGKRIGVGKEAPGDDEFDPPLSAGATMTEKLKHGLQTVTIGTGIVFPDPQSQVYQYPYDLWGFMRHPSMAMVPRQKDSFILISSGADRIYGTKDDVVYPAAK